MNLETLHVFHMVIVVVMTHHFNSH